MENLFETGNGISSEDEDCIEDELNWYKNEPEIVPCRTQTTKQMEVIQNLKTKMVLLVKKFKEKMGICGGRNQRLQEEHQGKISSQAHQVQKVKDLDRNALEIISAVF